MKARSVYRVYMARAFGTHKIIGGFEDALHPDSARLSVAVGRNSKACGNLLKAFVEIHNSLRSNNSFHAFNGDLNTLSFSKHHSIYATNRAPSLSHVVIGQ